jgi:hypothetical protein
VTRPGARRFGGTVAIVVVALAAAVAPLPHSFVERWYSRGIYPILQRTLTAVSNLLPFALLDVAVLLLLVAVVMCIARAAVKGGWRGSAGATLVLLLKVVAVTYLLFLALWGFNYRRVPLEEKLDFDRSRVDQAGAFALASEAVARVNALHPAAHAAQFDRSRFAASFAAAERTLGGAVGTRTGRPKRSLLGIYFRAAAIDGMTDPIFLEVILNSDLLPVELPDVLAHEWSHLAGYADESEASFLAWLTCLRGDSLAQYSGWLSAYRRVAGVLPRDARRQLPPLNEGPRVDLDAIATRLDRSSRIVRNAARDAYDSYLKANRIREGIENYDAVIHLMLGTSLGRSWSPPADPIPR